MSVRVSDVGGQQAPVVVRLRCQAALAAHELDENLAHAGRALGEYRGVLEHVEAAAATLAVRVDRHPDDAVGIERIAKQTQIADALSRRRRQIDLVLDPCGRVVVETGDAPCDQLVPIRTVLVGAEVARRLLEGIADLRAGHLHGVERVLVDVDAGQGHGR